MQRREAYTPGQHSKCRYCHKDVLWIKTTKGALAPCDPKLEQVDGQKLLVFPDGVTARTHAGFTGGYINHHATCTVWIKMQKQRKAAKAQTRSTSST
jgi:hypothetical protein